MGREKGEERGRGREKGGKGEKGREGKGEGGSTDTGSAAATFTSHFQGSALSALLLRYSHLQIRKG